MLSSWRTGDEEGRSGHFRRGGKGMFESSAGPNIPEAMPKKIEQNVRLPQTSHTQIGKAVANGLRKEKPVVKQSVMNMLLAADVKESSVKKVQYGCLKKRNWARKKDIETEVAPKVYKI